MKRILTLAVTVLALLLATSACTTETAARDAIRQSFPGQYAKALAIADCESGLDPYAVSRGGGNWGLFQINKVNAPALQAMGYSWDRIVDPYVNARLARKIYDAHGWRAWSCG